MTELLSNLHELAIIMQLAASVAIVVAIVVWAPTILRALRGASKQDKTIWSYLDKIDQLTDRLENETTTVYLDNPDGTPYVGPINAKLALEALQSAQEAGLDLRIRFADDFPYPEPDHADHAEN